MPPKPNDRVQYTVACRCGTKFSLDMRGFGRPRVCRKCGASLTVAWGKDPITRRSVPIVVTQARRRGGIRVDQAQAFATCLCGYKIPVPPSAVTSPPHCPGCGRLMVVEGKGGNPTIFGASLPKYDRPPSSTSIPAVPPLFRPTVVRAAPKPAAPKAPAGPAPKRPLRLGEVACSCGAIIPPRTSRTGKTFTCPSCRRQGRVDEIPDGKGGSSLKATFAGAPPAPAAPTPPPPPDTKKRAPAPPKPPPPPTPEKVPSFEDAVAGSDYSVADEDDQGQQVLCDCGSDIVVSRADVGQHAQCPQCGIVMLVEQVKDPAKGSTWLRVRTVGRMDQDTWTLEDFK